MARNAELDHPDSASRLDDADGLAHGRRRIVDVAKQVRESERIELVVAKREALGLAFDEGDPASERGVARQPRASPGEHCVALVEGNHVASRRADELGCDQPRSGGYIEHALTGARSDRLHHRAAPAWILAEGERG